MLPDGWIPDLEAEEIDDADHGGDERGEPAEQPGARRGEQAADADAEKAGEQDEVREVREQADVGRHPPDQRNFEKENEKGRDEGSPDPAG